MDNKKAKKEIVPKEGDIVFYTKENSHNYVYWVSDRGDGDPETEVILLSDTSDKREFIHTSLKYIESISERRENKIDQILNNRL